MRAIAPDVDFVPEAGATYDIDGGQQLVAG